MNNYYLLESLALEQNTTIEDMLESAVFDSVVPATCTECGNITEMEPDQDEGWCADCCTNTVKSALVLAGII